MNIGGFLFCSFLLIADSRVLNLPPKTGASLGVWRGERKKAAIYSFALMELLGPPVCPC